MKHIRRGSIIAAVVAGVLGAVSGNAGAAISPNPFNGSASGVLLVRSGLGSGACTIVATSGTLNGTTGGASGSITGVTFDRATCSGTMPAVSMLVPIGVSYDRGTVTFSNVAFLVTNSLGGRCLYGGTMTGTFSNGSTGPITVANPTVGSRTRLAGYCDAALNVEMTLGYSMVRITW